MSVVVACSLSVSDFDAWWSRTCDGLSLPAWQSRGPVFYRSAMEPNRVFVTFQVEGRQSVDDIVRSSELLTWFDDAGMSDVPPLFVGRLVRLLRFVEDGVGVERSAPAVGVIVARVMPVKDFRHFMSSLEATSDARAAGGCMRLWIYQALDDPGEVMTLEEVEDLASASTWVHKKDESHVFFDLAGVGIYPDTFVGASVKPHDVCAVSEA